MNRSGLADSSPNANNLASVKQGICIALLGARESTDNLDEISSPGNTLVYLVYLFVYLSVLFLYLYI